MTKFEVIRELASVERDRGAKRLLLALYRSIGETGAEFRYVALSEQVRKDENSEWESARKGITVRKSEMASIIAALQSADFDAKPDGKGLSHREYADATGYIT